VRWGPRGGYGRRHAFLPARFRRLLQRRGEASVPRRIDGDPIRD
jgi:hypothetical protein